MRSPLRRLHVSADSVSETGTLTVSADLTNTASVSGDDIEQLGPLDRRPAGPVHGSLITPGPVTVTQRET